VTSQGKALHVILGAVGRNFCSFFQDFAQIFRDFVKVYRDFAQISSDFARIFTKSKLLGVLLHARLLLQCGGDAGANRLAIIISSPKDTKGVRKGGLGSNPPP